MKKSFVILIGTVVFVAISGEAEVKSQSREGYVAVDDGLRLYYRMVGNGAETVITFFAAGWGMENFERLAQNRTIIFYDPRNRGRSDTAKNVSKLGIDYEVQDLENVRQHFKQEKFSIIGWSYLGGVVARYAMKYPDRVSRMIQTGSLAPAYNIRAATGEVKGAIPVDSAAIKQRDEMLKTGADKTDPEAYCHAYFRALLPRYFGEPSALDRIHIPCELPNEWPQNVNRTFRYLFGSLGNWDWRTEVASLKVPTLVIHGEKERIVPLEGSRSWAARPNARLLIIQGAGHFAFVDNPDAFFSAVDTFLKGKWPEGAQIVKMTNKVGNNAK